MSLNFQEELMNFPLGRNQLIVWNLPAGISKSHQIHTAFIPITSIIIKKLLIVSESNTLNNLLIHSTPLIPAFCWGRPLCPPWLEIYYVGALFEKMVHSGKFLAFTVVWRFSNEIFTQVHFQLEMLRKLQCDLDFRLLPWGLGWVPKKSFLKVGLRSISYR